MDKKIIKRLCFAATGVGIYYLCAAASQVYNMIDHNSRFAPMQNGKMQAYADAERARKENYETETKLMKRDLEKQ